MSCFRKGNASCAIPVIRDLEHLMSHRCKTEKGGFSGPGVVPYQMTVTNLPESAAFATGSVPVNRLELQAFNLVILVDADDLPLLGVP